jgi:glycosyltransferase involved in cell wall biosynthesis
LTDADAQDGGGPTIDGHKRSLRLALVTPGFPPDFGGVESVVAALASHLARRGHRIDVLAHARHGQPPSVSTLDEGVDVTVRRFPDRTRTRRFEVAPSLWRHLHRNGDRYDVVHAHSFHVTASLAAAVASTAPLVFTPHYHGVGHTSAARAAHVIYDVIASRIFTRARAIICVSHAEAALVVRDYPQAAAKITVIPNGVNVDEISAATPLETDRPVVLVAGRLEHYKQVDLAIRAAALMDTDVTLAIAGGGPQAGALAALVDDLGLSHRVRLLGQLSTDDLRRWQRTASVTLCLSRHEAFGLTLLEAAAAGSHVVATNIAAHVEVASTAGVDPVMLDVDVHPAVVAAAVETALSEARPAPLDVPTWQDVAARTEDVLAAAAG